MLQIYIHSEIDPGFLDLIPGTTLEMEALQEMFDEEIAFGEFSIPIQVEWTDTNRRRLQFSERIENFKRSENTWLCTVYDNMFPELIRAKFTILGKKGALNYRSGSFSASVAGSKGLYGSAIKNKKLADLTLGGPIDFGTTSSRTFAYQHATGLQPDYPYISFAPVAIEKFFDEDRKDYDGEFLAKDTVNTIVITGDGPNDWIFGRPNATNPSINTPAGDPGYIDYRTVPFFKLQYVLRQCFEQFGFRVSGDFIDDPAFNEMVIFNNYGIELYNTQLYFDVNRKITPSNHVPNAYIGEWLKSIFSLTKVFPLFMDDNLVRLVYHKTDIAVKQITSIDDDIDGKFESDYLDGTSTEKGYKLTYQWDTADQYYTERVKDLKDKTIVATVAKHSDLDSLTIGRQMTIDDIVLVLSENMFYQVADGTTFPVLYDAYSENLGEYISGEGERQIDIRASTLCTYVEQNPTSKLYERKNYVGCRQTGSYINNAGALVKRDFGTRVFYIHQRFIGPNKIPVSFNHNRDALNNIICPYSLAISGTDGIASTFHVPWLNIIENAELIKIVADGSPKFLQKLKSFNRFQLAGTVLILKQIERTIPAGPTVKLQMIAL